MTVGSPHRADGQPPVCPLATADLALKPYTPVTDVLIVEAIDRAECHERTQAVPVLVIAEHLGFEATPEAAAALHPRLEDLRHAGSLTQSEVGGQQCWSLADLGQKEIAKRREEGTVYELPESPQHRTWRRARVEAAVRVEEFKLEMGDLWEETDRLLSRRAPVSSHDWIDLGERLGKAAWRLGSAIHCMNEWVEPDDDEPDVDENPGPAPGRRTIAAWGSPDSSEPGGQA